MLPIGKEATDFVRACEAIHHLLERGDTLTPEDQDLIEFSATELLSIVKPGAGSRYSRDYLWPTPH
jgi:hypothetical protein